MVSSWDLRAIAYSLHILPAPLLLVAHPLAGLHLYPLANLPGIPHPSIGWRLLQSTGELFLLVFSEQRPVCGARVLMPAVPKGLRPVGVVTASELLYPAPGVSGDLHNLACGLALADE